MISHMQCESVVELHQKKKKKKESVVELSEA